MWIRRMARAIGTWALLLAALTLMPGGPAMAQTAAGPAASAADTVVPVPPASDAAASTISTEIQSHFGTLLMLTYLAVALGVAIGLYVYVWNRRRLRVFARLKGAVCAVVCALALYGLASTAVLTPDAAACASATLQTGERAGNYDDQCRDARERAGNAFGAVAAFRALFLAPDIPASAGVVRGLLLVSIPAFTLLFFFALRRVVRRLFVKP